ncbi:MAG: isochorismatase family cysteine hydrolase [Candidatus Omnitrophota bacterium]
MTTTAKIYKTLREIVDPKHTALVVWDVQNGLVNRSFNKEEFIKNLKPLIKSARDINVPVIYTKITPLPVPYESSFRIYLQMKRAGVDDPAKLPPFMAIGSTDAEIPSEVSPKSNEIVLNKHTTSIFIGTHFEHMMRNKGIDTIVFTGISTEVGVDSSARDASARGFYTVVVEDCVTTANKEIHEASLKSLGNVCLVVPSRDIMKEWK